MTGHAEMKCPKCGQQLRFPDNIGGMLMACPTCGQKFYTDFRLAGTGRSAQPGIVTSVFEMPSKIMAWVGRHFTLK